MSSPRAIVFDLDNTLYPERRFVLSGFAAVSRHLERQMGVPRCRSFRVLGMALRRGHRGTALQALCAELGLPDEMIPRLVDVIRTHRPRLRLPADSARVLMALRREWRIAVLTNGLPPVQARKVRALGLAPLVDHVVFACEHSPKGKPDKAAFVETLHRLGTEGRETVFVGDDPFCDIAGARRAGLRTIRVGRGPLSAAAAIENEADTVVRLMADVPAAANRLMAQELVLTAD